MMQVMLAKNSGFCFGVKRAIKLAEQTATKYGHATTIGPIIHNPQMVERLKNAGVIAIDDISLIETGPVIIRSHGVSIETLTDLQKKGLDIVDATCPYVSKAQEFAKMADKGRYQIFILGNPDHPEIIALKSYVEKATVIPTDISLTNSFSTSLSKVAVICQTTQNIDNLAKLVEQLLPISNELRIFNTICNATNVRQQSSLDLAKNCSIMIVIGGKNSSNTKMLANLCSEYTETKHIEVAEEIEEHWFKNLNNPEANIGLTAGASTPDWIIIDVYNKIKVMVGDIENQVISVDSIPGYKEGVA